jgi:GNAT superfamily N-acetyltransferase
MPMQVLPLTPEHWPAVEQLFTSVAPAARCWCMYFRVGPQYRRRPAEQNRDEFHAVVAAGPPPGLVAFDGDVAVGWLQLTPRDAIPAMDRIGRLKRVDDEPVWAISCFLVHRGHRKRGVSRALLESAIERARDAGAPALEAYPLDGTVSPSATSTGYASTFARAGFVEIARRSPERPIMRLDLRR